MITVQIGWGFPFRAEASNLSNCDVAEEYKAGKSLVLSAGIVSVCWWNTTAAQMWVRCLRVTSQDAAIIANARSEINRRVEAGVVSQISTERREFAQESERHWEQYHQSEDEKRELRGEIRDLNTALKMLAKAVK